MEKIFQESLEPLYISHGTLFKQSISGHSQFMPHLDDDITTFPKICQSKHPKETTDCCVYLHADGGLSFCSQQVYLADVTAALRHHSYGFQMGLTQQATG